MQLNGYNLYSIANSYVENNPDKNSKTTELIEILSHFTTPIETKEFFKNSYNLMDNVQNFYIETNSYLEINENDKKYSIKINYKLNEQNECVVFCYKK